MTLRAVSLFSGYGGLDLAVRAVLGAAVVWHAETDPAASRVLNAREPGVPNLGDIATINWAGVEADIVTAGYPCQPFSVAGQQKGSDDERYLWPEVARCIGVVRPGLVVLENVAGHLIRGFAEVLGSLAELGYDARWSIVRASDVGAPHRRERLFAVAYPDGEPWPRYGLPVAGDGARSACAGQGVPRRCGCAATDADRGALREQSEPEPGGRGAAEPRRCGAAPPDTNGDGLTQLGRQLTERRDLDGCGSADTAWGPYEPAIRRWERTLGRLAPRPTELNTRGGQRLSPRFVEWMMGLPAGWVTDVPGVSRNDQLKMLGNGVVPQQGEAALRMLLGAQ